ncbi:F-box/FBD/LRR-repeat protein At1g13570-like [Silene latifolia]|uniref:F-box/FBD/LRR-repeat protein At1g13570-like n=1 Tax=Silene latifolia TaxID=37657 RepID=UPI003D780971
MVDFFSNVPDIVIDTILEKLPIRMAAQTSVLSKQWRQAWLSLQHLRFDSGFQEQQKNKDGSCDWRKNSRIISSILLHHRGHVRDFILYVPDDADEDHMNLSQWISFLSQNGIQKVIISNWDCKVFITPYIFRCSDLVYLSLGNFSLNPPPSCFHGFPKLTYLSLVDFKFSRPNIFLSLIENCKMLATLRLDTWSGMDHVVIDSPRLQTLIIKGEFDSLAFRNVRSLKSISLCLKTMPKKVLTVETVDAINHLASSCQLQSIHFEGYLCQLLAAGGAVRSPPVTFNHLNELRLSNLNLSKFDVFRYLLSMIECCPYIKKLDISVIPGEKVGLGGHIFDLNYKYKLDRLRVVNIEGITGSSAELKLVEYVLAISASLENLFFKSGKCDTDSERKMSRALMRFPRASPKASLVCLDT